jgi:hypothetical protein
MLTASARLSKSTDHRFLLQVGFDLQPTVAPAAGEILACAVLGDHPFEAGFLHGIKECQTLLFNMVTERQAGDRGKDLPENLLALGQVQAAEIVPVQV